MSAPELIKLSARECPGLNGRAAEVYDGSLELETAGSLVRDLTTLSARAGTAWRDPEWMGELVAEHKRLGASATSMENLKALSKGAPCVVTGQQPAPLLGPLYSFYKILGAVALARDLSVRWNCRVVPVYWCGSDDSDFDEVRNAWMMKPGQGAIRAQLPASIWRHGQRIGGIDDPCLARLEREALLEVGAKGRVLTELNSMDSLTSLSDRARAWALRWFGDEGLVVVDARSRRLRSLGTEQFENYRSGHRSIAATLHAHIASLEARGRTRAFDSMALGSALFEIEGEFRRKIDPDALDNLDLSATEVAPSALLRPVWQDLLLAPVAAVLGPSELLYHEQIAPLYGVLGVEAARPVPRPHLTLVPEGLRIPDDAASREQWFAGAGFTRSALAEAFLPESLSEQLRRIAHATSEHVRDLTEHADSERQRGSIRRYADRNAAALGELRGRLASEAAQAQGIDMERILQWLCLRGVAQERIYSAASFALAAGDSSGALRAEIERAYIGTIDRGQAPCWAALTGECP